MQPWLPSTIVQIEASNWPERIMHLQVPDRSSVPYTHMADAWNSVIFGIGTAGSNGTQSGLLKHKKTSMRSTSPHLPSLNRFSCQPTVYISPGVCRWPAPKRSDFDSAFSKLWPRSVRSRLLFSVDSASNCCFVKLSLDVVDLSLDGSQCGERRWKPARDL